jgi:hypothetical protein
METQSSQEFLAELKVLTHVHHLNLVSPYGKFSNLAPKTSPLSLPKV